MKELQKYYFEYVAGDFDGYEKPFYLAAEADAAFARQSQNHQDEVNRIYTADAEIRESLKRQHAEKMTGLNQERLEAAAEQELLLYRKHHTEVQSLKRQHAEEIERLNSMLDSARLQAERYRADFWGEVEALRKQAERYEKLRRLNVEQFKCLFLENLKGPHVFDYLVDQLPASGHSSGEKTK